jgi:hypothetical protein
LSAFAEVNFSPSLRVIRQVEPGSRMSASDGLPKLVLEHDITEYRCEYDEYGNWTQKTRCVGLGQANILHCVVTSLRITDLLTAKLCPAPNWQRRRQRFDAPACK